MTAIGNNLKLFSGFLSTCIQSLYQLYAYTIIGYIWLLMGMKLRYIFILGLIILITNVIYEQWVSYLNIRDTVDIYYGIVGSLMGCVFLLFIKKYGLIQNDMLLPEV